MNTRDYWQDQAACQNEDPDALFVQGVDAQVFEARRICPTCPVRMECLAEALTRREDHGIWGGMTEYERRKLLRRHPDVTDWRRWLTTPGR